MKPTQYDYVELYILRKDLPGTKHTCTRSKERCLDRDLEHKILEALPDKRLLLEIIGYGVFHPEFYDYPNMHIAFQNSSVKCEHYFNNKFPYGVTGGNKEFFLNEEKGFAKVIEKIGLKEYKHILRVIISKYPKTILPLNRHIGVSLIPVISKEVDKGELKKILEGIRKTEEEIWKTKMEPAGVELFISSVDICSIENGEKKGIASYDMEGGLCIYK